jgi:hypothetical protein
MNSERGSKSLSKNIHAKSMYLEGCFAEARYRGLMRGYKREQEVGPALYWATESQRERLLARQRGAQDAIAALCEGDTVTWLSLDERDSGRALAKEMCKEGGE